MLVITMGVLVSGTTWLYTLGRAGLLRSQVPENKPCLPLRELPVEVGGNPWFNRTNCLDVNGDGLATVVDLTTVRRAIPVWRELNKNPQFRMPSPASLPFPEIQPKYAQTFFDQYGKVDVDGDLKLDDFDLIKFYARLGRQIYLWQNPFNRFDVNGDGSTTLSDASKVRRAITEWPQLSESARIYGNFSFYPEAVQFFDRYGYVDVAGNNDLNVDDLVALHAHLTGGSRKSVSLWQNPVNRFDVNGDGPVTLADVTNVRRAIPAWQQLSSAAKANGGATDQDSMAFFRSYGYADVDGDEDTNVNDLVDLHRHLNPGSTSLWQNPVMRQDVNGDGSVTSADADKVRDAVNNWRQLSASAKANGGVTDPAGRELFDRYGYLDVNGDGDVTRQDTDSIPAQPVVRPTEAAVPRTVDRPASRAAPSICERARSWGTLWRRTFGCE